jgi:predicted nucleic acid-binding protein
MATLTIDRYDIFLPPSTMFLDTCVLFSAFFPEDSFHQDALDFMREDQPLLVPYVVLGEAWGMLVGSRRRPDCGMNMLAFMAERPNTQFVPVWSGLYQQTRDLCSKRGIDLVDAFLMCMSSSCVRLSKLKRPVPIATYDTRDFSRCYGALSFGCFDLRDRCLLWDN